MLAVDGLNWQAGGESWCGGKQVGQAWCGRDDERRTGGCAGTDEGDFGGGGSTGERCDCDRGVRGEDACTGGALRAPHRGKHACGHKREAMGELEASACARLGVGETATEGEVEVGLVVTSQRVAAEAGGEAATIDTALNGHCEGEPLSLIHI